MELKEELGNKERLYAGLAKMRAEIDNGEIEGNRPQWNLSATELKDWQLIADVIHKDIKEAVDEMQKDPKSQPKAHIMVGVDFCGHFNRCQQLRHILTNAPLMLDLLSAEDWNVVIGALKVLVEAWWGKCIGPVASKKDLPPDCKNLYWLLYIAKGHNLKSSKRMALSAIFHRHFQDISFECFSEDDYSLGHGDMIGLKVPPLVLGLRRIEIIHLQDSKEPSVALAMSIMDQKKMQGRLGDELAAKIRLIKTLYNDTTNHMAFKASLMSYIVLCKA
jgi:hypothetical protein